MKIIIRLCHNCDAVPQFAYRSASTGPGEANLHWSVLSVQVPECKARGAGGMLPQENIFEFDAFS